MTELSAFKSFVASISETWPEEQIAEALGRAKALWGEAALSLNCVRSYAKYGAFIESKAASKPEAKAALDSIIAALTGPKQKLNRRV